ncbi:MAG: NADPH-dependent FMN reductase [Gemmatimonadales bacterium]
MTDVSSPPIRILGLAGSLRRESLNRAALRAAQELAAPDAVVEIFELDGIPLYNDDLWSAPPRRVLELKDAAWAADAILFVTPEYNYSVSGVLKNAIDWASRPQGDSAWQGKPAAVMGVSPGAIGTGRAQYHLRQCFVFLEMPALNQPEVLITHAAQKFDAQLRLVHDPTRARIRALIVALCDLTRRMSPTPALTS